MLLALPAVLLLAGADAPLALQPRAFEPLSLSAITPQGWLLTQLRIQANGLSGFLDQFWPQVSEGLWTSQGQLSGDWTERPMYWLNGQVPLHHLLANADANSTEAARTGASVRRFLSFILSQQNQSTGWLGPSWDNPSGKHYWSRFYMLFALAMQAEAAAPAERAQITAAMLRHVNATAAKMAREGWIGRATKLGPLWAPWRIHEYILGLQWLVDHAAPTSEVAGRLMEHMVDVSAVSETCDWEGWFANWSNAFCRPGQVPPPPAPPPPPPGPAPLGCICGRDCCFGLDLPTVGAFSTQQSLAECKSHCRNVQSATACVFQDSKRHGRKCFCKKAWEAAGPEPNATWPSAGSCACNITESAANSKAAEVGDRFGADVESTGFGGWPHSCLWPSTGGGITHGVNTAEAIKSAAVLWRISGDARLRALSNARRSRIDEKYGVATGLFCADESLCAPPDASEEDRRSPSRGTEL